MIQEQMLFIARKELNDLEAERNHLMNMIPFCIFPEDVIDLREKIEEIDADIVTIRRNIQIFQKFIAS